MKKYKEFRKSGTFFVSKDRKVYGDLTLKKAKTTLNLHSKESFETQVIQNGCITGVLHDRKKVSLIDCITNSSSTSGYGTDDMNHTWSIFPHFIIFGDEHITSADQKISTVHFVVDDSATLFYDFDAFGHVIDAQPYIEQIVRANKLDRNIELGPNPEIFYFTGKNKIFETVTVLGTVSATHNIGYRSPSPKGLSLKNKIHLNIDFPEKVTISEAITRVTSLLRFMEVIVGRPQNILNLFFQIHSAAGDLIPLDVYWSMPPRRKDANEQRSPHPADLPLFAAKEPDNFARILRNWLDRHEEWSSARFRFASSFANQHKYDIDRIVGAANMFDILPASAVPVAATLDNEIKVARKVCKAMFEKLPKSPERDSILSALGRLGKSNLKQKIRSRSQLIVNSIGEQFPDLNIVVDAAVNCRNYFVHGSETKIDYSNSTDQLIFFIETLEFIFATSDLIEAGWDIKVWSQNSTAMTHPFGRYRINYDSNLIELKKFLSPTAALE